MSELKRELYVIEEKIKEIGAELQKNETKNSKIKYEYWVLLQVIVLNTSCILIWKPILLIIYLLQGYVWQSENGHQIEQGENKFHRQISTIKGTIFESTEI